MPRRKKDQIDDQLHADVDETNFVNIQQKITADIDPPASEPGTDKREEGAA